MEPSHQSLRNPVISVPRLSAASLRRSSDRSPAAATRCRESACGVRLL